MENEIVVAYIGGGFAVLVAFIGGLYAILPTFIQSKQGSKQKKAILALHKILAPLDPLKDVQKQVSPGTGVKVEVSKGNIREVAKLLIEQKEEYTKLVNTLGKEFFEWKKKHNREYFAIKNRDIVKAIGELENFFTRKRSSYGEEDFVKIFSRRKALLEALASDTDDKKII